MELWPSGFPLAQQLATLRRIMRVSRRQSELPRRALLCGKHKIFVVQPPLDFPMDCEPSFADFALSKQFFLNFFHFFVI